MPFTPFAESEPALAPWTPFTTANIPKYLGLRARYDNHVPNGLPIASSRLTSGTQASGVWEPTILTQGPLRNLSQEVGFLYDDLFIALCSASPCEVWYMKMLAIRDSMYKHWIGNPRNHSKTNTAILVLLCNAIAILDIRFLP